MDIKSFEFVRFWVSVDCFGHHTNNIIVIGAKDESKCYRMRVYSCDIIKMEKKQNIDES